MGKRLEIGLIYRYTPKWMGGVYYLQNLIKAMCLLPEKEQPIFHVFCNDLNRFEELKIVTGYKFLKYRALEVQRGKLHLYFLLFLWKLLSDRHVSPYGLNLMWSKISFIYPVCYEQIRPMSKILGWIPDFQERYLPMFFTDIDIKQREINHRMFVKHRLPVIFSSTDAKNDFDTFYPEHKSKTYILRFAVTHPEFSHININEVRKKYNISGEYLFCANQFWVHKNHMFLFEAFKKAKEKGLKLQLVCSGCIQDYRDDHYGEKIRRFIANNNMEKDIIITGFINREEQLALMKNSYAIVQPSLFEGWSTVVEDAKALNKFIFLSNLKVHKEQAPVNVEYFDPHDIDSLVKKLLHTPPTSIEIDYTKNRLQFAEDFIKIAKDF